MDPTNESAAALPAATAKADATRRTELFIGACVVLISLVSLFVAVSANRTQERLLAASTWPNLQYSSSNAGGDGTRAISFNLLNNGVGPARIRSFDLRYHGKSMRNSSELLRECCLRDASQTAPTTTVSTVRRRVLAPNEEVTFLRVPLQASTEATWQVLNREAFNVQLRVCYCSVLDDCWMLDTGKPEPEPESVKACPATPAGSGWEN
jgi:hypothetical protein